MKKTRIISLTLSLAIILAAFVSVNMTSVSAAIVTLTYDFDTIVPNYSIQEGANVTAEVINANASFSTTKSLKIGSLNSSNYTQNCVVVDVNASDSNDITFDAGQEKGLGIVLPHFGIVYNGDIYWDTTNSLGRISIIKKGAFSNYSVVDHSKFYKFTGKFNNINTNFESLVINSNNVSNITGLVFKPTDIASNGHLLVDNITVQYETAVDSSMVEGASLRLGANNGIRFISNLDSAKIEELKSYCFTVEMGTLIAPADLLGSDELTFDLDANKYIDVPTSGYYADGKIAGSIKVNLSKNITREFVSRGYVKVFKDDQLIDIDYATANDNVRSLKMLANSWINDEDSFNLLNEVQQARITAWANAE